MDAYKMRGILPEKPATWKKTPPTISLVNRLYQQDDAIAKKDSLSAAMEKLEMFEIFEKDPSRTVSLFDMVEGVVVVDLSGYDPDIQSLIVAITLNLFYSQMVATGSSSLKDHYRQVTKLILVDEADNFMSEDFPSLKKIMKEGREFGVGVVLATQSMKHFETADNSYEDYILTWVVHNVSDLREKDVDFVFRVPPKGSREKEIYNAIKKLEKFQSIVKIGNEEPVRIRDRAFWELYRDMKK
jgi:DNA phosphorothioation-dependent restriction protein DptH